MKDSTKLRRSKIFNPAPEVPGLFITLMQLPVFFIETVPPDDFVTLSEETSKHVVQVLRMQPQEKLRLTDGAGSLLTAEIADAHKKKCLVKITGRQTFARQKKQVCLAVSLLKNSTRFEWFLEKSTETGVSQIIPLLCERTEKQHFRFERMRQILVSAMLQSKQVWLPQLHEPTPVSQIIAAPAYATNLIAHCADEEKQPIREFAGQESIQILIGPEGDFSEAEISLASQRNWLPVSLGSNRLRTETAAVAAAVLLCL